VQEVIAFIWALVNRAGGEIHLTKEELSTLPRGAQLQQKKIIDGGVTLIALDPWKSRGEKLIGHDEDMPTEQELAKEFYRPDLDENADATGDTPTTM